VSTAIDSAGRDVLLYDGHCRLCVGGAKAFRKLMPSDKVVLQSFREPGVLERYPQLTLERCEKGMQLIRPDGRHFEGAEAVVQGLRYRWWGKAAFVYYVPGLRQLVNWVYGLIARYRFKILGRTCDSEACAIHYR
jgi:predicted DCC family thiol-disulfide oxidoreductase YuxK